MLKMIQFRSLTAGAAVTGFSVADDGKALAFARDGAGFFALNIAETSWDISLQTNLAEGSYVDLISGENVDVLSDGFADLSVPALGLVALVAPTPTTTLI